MSEELLGGLLVGGGFWVGFGCGSGGFGSLGWGGVDFWAEEGHGCQSQEAEQDA